MVTSVWYFTLVSVSVGFLSTGFGVFGQQLSPSYPPSDYYLSSLNSLVRLLTFCFMPRSCLIMRLCDVGKYGQRIISSNVNFSCGSFHESF